MIQLKPATNNYAKSLGERDELNRLTDIKYHWFNDNIKSSLTEAKQWLREEKNAGRQVSVFRRVEGIEVAVVGDFSYVS